MGHVLLAGLPDDELDQFLAHGVFVRHTDNTLTDRDALRAELMRVRQQGWALVDQELEVGLRSVAAPIRGANGRTIAAMNVSAAAARVSKRTLRESFLPELLHTADQISASLASGTPGGDRT